MVVAEVPAAEVADTQDDVMEDPLQPDEQEDLDDEDSDLELHGEGEDDDQDMLLSGDDADIGGGAPLSPSAIPTSGGAGRDSIAPSISLADETRHSDASLNPTRPTPYVHDAGHLLIVDPNPVPRASSDPATTEAFLTANARDAAQSLLNHLLTTCPIMSSKDNTSGSGVNMTLPTPDYVLPREKRIPQPKAPTKWEQFAAKKGIGKNKRKGQEGEDQAGKKVYDEATGEWVPKYGYKGKNKQGEGDWLVEIDEKADKKKAQAAEAGGDPRSVSRGERKERIKRNDRKMRANERKSGKAK